MFVCLLIVLYQTNLCLFKSTDIRFKRKFMCNANGGCCYQFPCDLYYCIIWYYAPESQHTLGHSNITVYTTMLERTHPHFFDRLCRYQITQHRCGYCQSEYTFEGRPNTKIFCSYSMNGSFCHIGVREST